MTPRTIHRLSHRLVLIVAVLLVALGLLTQFPLSTRAQRAPGTPATARPPAGLPPGVAQPSAPQPREFVEVVIELDDQPVAELYAQPAFLTVAAAQRIQAAQTQLARVALAQDALLATLNSQQIKVTVMGRLQRVFNGISAQVPAAELERIANQPGVKAVHPVTVMQFTSNAAVPFIGTPTAWTNGTGLKGEGLKVGVIDSGIDYLHTDFGGPGSGYGSNNPTIVGDAPNFPGAKVAGGFDFTGDNFDANSSDPAKHVPQPDPDPMDCLGHGTAVASVVGGYGVNADGTTYTGAYNAATPFSTMRIAPGVAPAATLYALKVGGCANSTLSSLVAQAIEWSIDPNGDGNFADRMDVINLSIGRAGSSPSDIAVITADNAALAGVIVVGAQGNDGDTYYINGGPGSAGRALSAAGSRDDGLIVSGNPRPDLADTMTDFSSRGPRNRDSMLKPDLSAPAEQITYAQVGTGNGAGVSAGTSFAAPLLAGGLTLLRQLHPTWTVEELKALVMNTAVFDLFANPNLTPPRQGPGRAGAGRLALANAVTANAVAFNADDAGLVSVSFGAIEVTATTALTKNIRVVNKGGAAVSYTVSYDGITDIPGVSYSFPGGATINVPANGSTTFQIKLDANPALMKHTRDAALLTTIQGFTRHWQSEESGLVKLTPASGPVLRVPVYVTARPASVMTTSQTQLDFTADTGTININLTGQGVNTGASVPTDVISLVAPYELQEISPDDTASTGYSNEADLKYVGVRSDYLAQGSVANTTLYFGLAMQQAWSTPLTVFPEIYFDTNQDGVDDYLLYRAWSNNPQNSFSDVTFTVLQNLTTNALVSQYWWNLFSADQYDTNYFNNNVVALGVRAADLGLTEANARFSYQVRTFSAATGAMTQTDNSSRLGYNAKQPGLSFGNIFYYFDQNGNTIPVQYNRPHFQANASRGVLLLHHHNAAGNREQALLATNPCNYALSSSGQTFTSAASTGSVNVTAGSGCAWTAVSNASFATVTGGASGSGNGTVNFSVAANSGVERGGMLAIAGQHFNVTQATGSALAITNVMPKAGRTTGGQQIKLTGAFANLSTVIIGRFFAPWFYSIGTSEITVTTPAVGDVGVADILLTPTSGNAYLKAKAFAYLPTTFTDQPLVAASRRRRPYTFSKCAMRLTRYASWRA